MNNGRPGPGQQRLASHGLVHAPRRQTCYPAKCHGGTARLEQPLTTCWHDVNHGYQGNRQGPRSRPWQGPGHMCILARSVLGRQPQFSRKPRKRRFLEGWRSFSSARASICRTRSRLSFSSLPISSRVRTSTFPRPNRARRMNSSLGERA